jgi:hypothetical protein
LHAGEFFEIEESTFRLLLDLISGIPKRIFKFSLDDSEGKFDQERISKIADLLHTKRKLTEKLGHKWISYGHLTQKGWEGIRDFCNKFSIPSFFIEILTKSKTSASKLENQAFNTKEFNKMVERFIKNCLRLKKENQVGEKYWKEYPDMSMVNEKKLDGLISSPLEMIGEKEARAKHFMKVIRELIRILEGKAKRYTGLNINGDGAILFEKLITFLKGFNISSFFEFVTTGGNIIEFGGKKAGGKIVKEEERINIGQIAPIENLGEKKEARMKVSNKVLIASALSLLFNV